MCETLQRSGTVRANRKLTDTLFVLDIESPDVAARDVYKRQMFGIPTLEGLIGKSEQGEDLADQVIFHILHGRLSSVIGKERRHDAHGGRCV